MATRYVVTGAIARFGAGVTFGLSEEQVRRRRHLLEPVGGHWRSIAPVEFKRGEVIEFDGPAAKVVLAELAPPAAAVRATTKRRLKLHAPKAASDEGRDNAAAGTTYDVGDDGDDNPPMAAAGRS